MSIAQDPKFQAPSIVFFAGGSILLILLSIATGNKGTVLKNYLNNKFMIGIFLTLLFIIVSAFQYYMSTDKIPQDNVRKGILGEFIVTKFFAYVMLMYLVFNPSALTSPGLIKKTAIAIVVVRILFFAIENLTSLIRRKSTVASISYSQPAVLAFIVLSIVGIIGAIALNLVNDGFMTILFAFVMVVGSLGAAIAAFISKAKGSVPVGLIALVAFVSGVIDVATKGYNKHIGSKVSVLFLMYALLQFLVGTREVAGAETPTFYTPAPQKPAVATTEETRGGTIGETTGGTIGETTAETTAETTGGTTSVITATSTPLPPASVDMDTILSLVASSTKGSSDNQVTSISSPAMTAAITSPVNIVNNDDFSFLKNAYAERPASLSAKDYLPVNSAVISTPCIVALLGETLEWFKKHTLNSCVEGYPFCLAPNEDGTCIVPSINVSINNQNKAYLNGMIAGFFKSLFPDIPATSAPYQTASDNNKWTAGYNSVVNSMSLVSQQIYKPVPVRSPTLGLAGPVVVSASSPQNLFISSDSKLLSSLSFKVDKSRLSEGSGDPKKSFHVKLTDATASSVTIFQFTKCAYFIPDPSMSKGGIRGTTISDRLQIDMFLVKLPTDSYKIVSIQELGADGSVVNVITKRFKSNTAWVGSTCSISVGEKFGDNTKCPTASKNAPELFEVAVSSVSYTYSTISNQVRLGGSLSSVFYPVVLTGGAISSDQSSIVLSLDGSASPSQVMFGDNYKINNTFSTGGRLPGRSVAFRLSLKGTLSYAFLQPTPDVSVVIDNLGAVLVVKQKRVGTANPNLTLSAFTGLSVKGRIDVNEGSITIMIGDNKAVFSTATPKTVGSTLFLGAAGAGTITVSDVSIL